MQNTRTGHNWFVEKLLGFFFTGQNALHIREEGFPLRPYLTFHLHPIQP